MLKKFSEIISAAYLLAKTIWKSMTFLPHFAKFSTLKGYFSAFIGATGMLLCIIFCKGLGYRLATISFQKISRSIVISKNKLEKIELFAIFYQIVKIETLCLRKF